MNSISADLHIHSVLSPCGDAEMLPPRVLERAVGLGLDYIAITDHNSTLNVAAFCEAAAGLPVQVVPGIEMQTREDIHLICLFDDMEKIPCVQELVDLTLPKVKNREDFFGPQLIVDAEGHLLGSEDRLLLNSLELSLEEAVTEVVNLGGICIAAHVDRQAFSLLGVLGFIPPELPLAALEISRPDAAGDLLNKFVNTGGYPLVYASDAHYLKDMGRSVTTVNHNISNLHGLFQVIRGNV